MLIEALLLSQGPLKRGKSVTIRSSDGALAYKITRGLLSGNYTLVGLNPLSRQKVREHQPEQD